MATLRDRRSKAELLRQLRYSAWESVDFDRCHAIIKEELPAPDDSVERARVFLVNNQQSFNKSGGTHSISEASSGISKWKAVGVYTSVMADRIRDCTVLCEDYSDALRRKQINDERTLVYADPPYFGVEKTFYAVNNHDGFDHAALRRSLDQCRASIIVSYEDCEAARALYSKSDGWARCTKDVTRGLGNKGKKATEVLFISVRMGEGERATHSELVGHLRR